MDMYGRLRFRGRALFMPGVCLPVCLSVYLLCLPSVMAMITSHICTHLFGPRVHLREFYHFTVRMPTCTSARAFKASSPGSSLLPVHSGVVRGARAAAGL